MQAVAMSKAVFKECNDVTEINRSARSIENLI